MTTYQIGRIFGLLSLFSLIFLALRMILKLTMERLKKNGKTQPSSLRTINRFFMQYHRYVGIFAVIVVITHALIQSFFIRFVWDGFAAAFIYLLQAFLGFGLRSVKDRARRAKMSKLHQALGILLVIAVIIHRL